jgi:hypothetical protein
MVTARDIVEGALRRIGVVASNQPIPPEMGEKTLRALNAMMASWQTKGLSYVHGRMVMADAFPMPEAMEEGVTAMLAVRMTDDYAPEALTPALRRDQREAWSSLCGYFFEVPKAGFDLPRRSRETDGRI